MRSTRLPLGGVMFSGKKLTSVSKSCVRWAYVWSTSEKPGGGGGSSSVKSDSFKTQREEMVVLLRLLPRGIKSELDLKRAEGRSWNWKKGANAFVFS